MKVRIQAQGAAQAASGEEDGNKVDWDVLRNDARAARESLYEETKDERDALGRRRDRKF